MYYRHRDFYGGELLGLALVLCLIVAYFVIKGALFVIRTFVKYSDHRSLWIALALCVVLSAVGMLLGTQVAQSYGLLLVVGIVVLLITCCVVSLRNRDTLMRENVKLIDEVLHTSWWGSEDTPQPEKDHEPLAA